MKEQQTPRDRVLWILGSQGETNISRLRSMTGRKKADPDAVLAELEKENRVVIRHRSVMLKR